MTKQPQVLLVHQLEGVVPDRPGITFDPHPVLLQEFEDIRFSLGSQDEAVSLNLRR